MMGLSIDSMATVLAPWVAFFAVLFAGVALYQVVNSRAKDANRRLRHIEGGGEQEKVNFREAEGEFLVRWLQPAGAMILPQAEWRRSAMKRRLVYAGYRQPRAIYLFLGAKLFAALTLSLSAAALVAVLAPPLTLFTPIGYLCVLVAMVVGFILPSFILDRRITNRRQGFIESFPDALDMLVVCVEAGLGLDAAINRVARELHHSHPELAGELSLISLEVRAGKTRREAFQSLASRMEIPQVQSLATIIIQAERFGTSIATALRNFAEEMRVDRIQRAKETAAKLPVKMIFPIVLFIFPALFLVLLGPAVVQIITGFSAV